MNQIPEILDDNSTELKLVFNKYTLDQRNFARMSACPNCNLGTSGVKLTDQSIIHCSRLPKDDTYAVVTRADYNEEDDLIVTLDHISTATCLNLR